MALSVKEVLLSKLPKKYHDRVRNFEEADDLIDNCKYLLYWTSEYTDGECYGSCYPVRSYAEAIEFIKEALHK